MKGRKQYNCIKSIIYLGINLAKEVKDLHSENYKILMNEIGDERRDGKISSALELEEVILFKWPYSPKQSTDLK